MSDSVTIPKERVRIFDRAGLPVAEFRASVTRSWVIGGEGRASFTVASRKTDVCNKTVLQFGNWLLVENDLLPPWAGVIDTPREWKPRAVVVNAFSPERVFAWRRGNDGEKKLTGSAGAIFDQMIGIVNVAELTAIRSGTIWRGGAQREETVTPATLDRNLRRILERSKEENSWRPVETAGGKLEVYGDWSERLGVFLDMHLLEGTRGGNIEATSNPMIEDGPLANDIFGYGEGSTWNSRPRASQIDFGSVGTYGLRQGYEEYTGVSQIATIQANALEDIKNKKNPRKRFDVNALNIADLFLYLRLGNRLNLRMQTCGFSGSGTGYEGIVRIIGMAYSSNDRKAELVLEEVL